MLNFLCPSNYLFLNVFQTFLTLLATHDFHMFDAKFSKHITFDILRNIFQNSQIRYQKHTR